MAWGVRRRLRPVVAGVWRPVAAGTAVAFALAAAVPAGAVSVRVRPGDNLTTIARQYGVTVPALAAQNHLANPNQVLIGAVLQIPGAPAGPPATPSSRTIVLAAGDTLSAIAARAGVTVGALAQANGITNPNRVLAGARLTVPGAPGPPSSNATEPVAYVTPIASNPPLPPLLLAHPDRLALRPVFQRWAAAFGVPAALLEAMCWWESGWQTGVVSPTGAVGIGQLEPTTVRLMQAQLGNRLLNPLVASDNIEMSAAFMHDLLVATGANQQRALAGYYQGLTSVSRSGLFPSTRRYVHGILAYVPAFS